MRILLMIVLVLLALWDCSGGSQAFGVSFPLLSLTVLISSLLLSDLERIFLPILATGITLDLYGGMSTGSITLALLLSFLGGEIIKNRWLSGTAPFMRFALSLVVYLSFTLILLALQLAEFHKVSVAHNPFALLLAAILSGVITVLVSLIFSPHRERLSVKGLQ